MSESSNILAERAAAGVYVFHGTGANVTQLVPRQAYEFDGKTETPDGEPAVFASSDPAYAIFMAVVSKENCPEGYWAGSGVVNDVLTFNATRETLQQLTDDSGGWVYILPLAQFQQRDEGGVEYVAYHPVEPVEKVWVTKADLPPVQIREE